MPAMAKNSRASATLPAEKLRLRNSDMSSIGSSRRISQPTNSDRDHGPDGEVDERSGRGPAALGCLDDGVHERADRGDGQAGADRVEPRGVRVAGVGNQVQRADEGGDQQWHVDPEHRRPREAAHQRAADDRSERDAGAGGRGPCGDRLGAFAGIAEHVDEDRQRGRHDQRAAEAHDAAAGDERRRRACGGGDDRAGEERGQAGEECVSATEPVAEASGGEQQPGEHDGVGRRRSTAVGRSWRRGRRPGWAWRR